MTDILNSIENCKRQEILEKHQEGVKHKPVYVVCAAIYFCDGRKYPHQPTNIESGLVVCGYRHCSIFQIIKNFPEKGMWAKLQGFLSSDNRFLSRTEANLVAFGAGQISEEVYNSKSELFSEDIY